MAKRKRFSTEQIIAKLRQVEVEAARGQPVLQVCRKVGISEQTDYRWRRQYGGMAVDQAKKLKGLEVENARLKRVVADQALDISILREAASGNF
jgi:transposase-like protein